MKPYLPVYASSNVVDGKVAAMPGFADAMFMYYRRDLLEKHKVAEPKTWDELAAAAKKIQAAEAQAGNPALQGLSIQGAPIEGAVCTFLLPYWSQGREFNDAAGKLTLDRAAAAKGMQQWLTMVDAGVIKKNVAEVKTPTRSTSSRPARWSSPSTGGSPGTVSRTMPTRRSRARSASCRCRRGRWPERHLHRWLAMGGQCVQQAQGRSREAGASHGQPRGQQVPGGRRLAAADLRQRLHRPRRVEGRALVQGRGCGGGGGQEPADVARLRAGERRDPHHHECVLARTKTPEQGAAEIASRLARVMR
jgi:hypothetical protein